jgi:hypothetical protein
MNAMPITVALAWFLVDLKVFLEKSLRIAASLACLVLP